jgi:lipopolysaccharide/colanic/teichoic acid biosynthesis glycosyltransferase
MTTIRNQPPTCQPFEPGDATGPLRAQPANRLSVKAYRHFGKRLLDLLLVIPALLLLAPLLGLVALLVRLKLGTPILFRQQRPGQYGQPFTILKFRTMANGRDHQGRLLPDAERLTPLGNFLRRTSLDELPELFNMLKGEMSLVGPRPLLMKYLNRYDPEQMRRHEVKPGLSGYAQIKGRNTLTWEEKLKYDIWYVDHASLGLDLKIIWLTAWKVLKREGISHPGQATMTEFKAPAATAGSASVEMTGAVKPNGAGPTKNEAMGAIAAFSPEFKAQVVLEVLSGVKSALETCREYGLDPPLLARWQGDFVENAARAFQGDEPRY